MWHVIWAHIQAHKSKYVIELLRLKHKMDIHQKNKAEAQLLKARPIRARLQSNQFSV